MINFIQIYTLMTKLTATLLLGMGLTVSGFNLIQIKAWPVPDAAASKKNPVTANPESIKNGKSIYDMHCKSCHGAKGFGDGTKAAQLKTLPHDLSKPEVQSQKDGSLFYKISEGRDDMPSFKKLLADEEDRWALVNYIRKLKQ
ncbi:MAG: hypothetical protein RLZZ28_379 [Bacteroidota bacterium]|jgi:mono/diheme cytochrome c family protein